MAKPFFRLLCFTYGVLCSLFVARVALDRISRPAKSEPTPRPRAQDEFARHESSRNWMHRGRPGLNSGDSFSRDNQIH